MNIQKQLHTYSGNVDTLIFFGDFLKTWLTNDFNNDVFCNWSKIEIILGNRRIQ